MNRDHTVVFEIVPKYCIMNSFTDYESYCISSKGLFQTVSVPFEITDVLTGDVNSDGVVSMTDAIIIIGYILGDNPDDFDATAADLNGDGEVTITDASILMDMIP